MSPTFRVVDDSVDAFGEFDFKAIAEGVYNASSVMKVMHAWRLILGRLWLEFRRLRLGICRVVRFSAP